MVEAQYFGIPIVTTQGGGAIEAVIEGVTGTVCLEDEPYPVACAVEEILKQSKDKQSQRKIYEPFFKQHFSLDGLGQKFVELYESVS